MGNVKLPGVGEVKKPVIYGSATLVVGIVGYAYYKRRKGDQTAAASANSSAADSGIDPTTGLPYSQESGVYGFGGTDPATGVPYIYEQQNQPPVASTTGFTNNADWLAKAEGDAVDLFGADLALATSALGKYLAQSPSGLNDNEYLLVSEVVAELGQPPNGQPFRLIHAQPPVTVPTPSPTPTPITDNPPPVVQGSSPAPRTTTVTVVPFGNPAPWNSTMWGIANHFGIPLSKLEAANPSVTPPNYVIHPGQTITVPLS